MSVSKACRSGEGVVILIPVTDEVFSPDLPGRPWPRSQRARDVCVRDVDAFSLGPAKERAAPHEHPPAGCQIFASPDRGEAMLSTGAAPRFPKLSCRKCCAHTSYR